MKNLAVYHYQFLVGWVLSLIYVKLSFFNVDSLLSHLTWCYSVLPSGHRDFLWTGGLGCPRKFTCFKSLRQHLSRHANEVAECEIPGPGHTADVNNIDMCDGNVDHFQRN